MTLFKRKEYKLKILGKKGMIYSEKQGSINIFSEMLIDGEYDLVIYLSRIDKWDNDSKLSSEDKKRIKLNIEKEFKSSKIEWD